MAFWNRRMDGRVYVYTCIGNKQRALPRDEIRHLDKVADNKVEEWVINYTEQVEGKVDHERLYSDDWLNEQVEEYSRYRAVEVKRDEATVNGQRARLINFAFPFFLKNGLKNPASWPTISTKLLPYLRDERHCKPHQIDHVNTALKLFYIWLIEEKKIPDQKIILRRASIKRQKTPLKRVYTPDDIIKFVYSTNDWDLRMMALLGYFFSLRTQETSGLNKNDFVAGKSCQTLEASKVMAKHSLFDRLALDVARQARRGGEIDEGLKTEASKDWVCCFDERAARLIVEGLKEVPDGQNIFTKMRPDNYWKKWREQGLGSLKDLRRASLYWLGHHTDLGIMALKNHARHTRVETTALYCRRPDQDLPRGGELNLDL